MRIVNGLLYRLEWKFRYLTRGMRVLPNFIIIGGMKCGTTALYNYLGQHPHVVKASKKEIHFFDNQYTRGISWYKQFFPLASRMGGLVTGEASPYYIFHPAAAKRISSHVPGVKLIALFRNPVDRAFSHYQHTKRKGYETLSFREAVERESERLKGEERQVAEHDAYNSHAHQAHSYVSRGIYWKQLQRYYDWFDASSILVLKSEELLVRPQDTFDEVTDFLGLDSCCLRNASPVNKADYTRRKTETHKDLKEFFRPHNEKLYQMIGRDFEWN